MPKTKNFTLRNHALAIVMRVLLGAWFLYSGGGLIFASGLDRFTVDIANYQLVKPPFDAIAAYCVPWLECIAGLCLMLGIMRRGAILAIAGLVVMFAVAIGWAWLHKLDITCGCHGGNAPISYWKKVAEFSAYFACLGWLWWLESFEIVGPKSSVIPRGDVFRS
jgi:uncharacterized membrane protein YphA (DoxX/SURF4 family)